VAIERAKNGKKTCYLHDVGMFRRSRNGAIHITPRRPKNAAFHIRIPQTNKKWSQLDKALKTQDR